MTVSVWAAKANPIGIGFRRGRLAESDCLGFLATPFQRIVIRTSLSVSKGRQVTAAPFNLQSGKPYQQKDDDARVEQRVNRQSQRAKNLLAEVFGAAP